MAVRYVVLHSHSDFEVMAIHLSLWQKVRDYHLGEKRLVVINEKGICYTVIHDKIESWQTDIPQSLPDNHTGLLLFEFELPISLETALLVWDFYREVVLQYGLVGDVSMIEENEVLTITTEVEWVNENNEE